MSDPQPSESGYRPDLIEPKWQARWAERRTNEPDLDRAERPFYNLMMFPYPSAEGLHVGNFFAFAGADVYGRFQRLRVPLPYHRYHCHFARPLQVSVPVLRYH